MVDFLIQRACNLYLQVLIENYFLWSRTHISILFFIVSVGISELMADS